MIAAAELAPSPPGISQEKLPLYLGFFEFIRKVRDWGESVWGSLIGRLIAPFVNSAGAYLRYKCAP